MDDDQRRRVEQERFVEEMGIYLEQDGFPRMAGRIIGWLLICDPPRQTAGELAAALQASRGSISTMTQLLVRHGMVERLGVPGERQDYFQIRPNAGTYIMQQAMGMTRTVTETLDRGMRLVADQTPENQERLREFRDLYAFIDRELPGMLERWERERKEGKAEP